jgi:hypothetical protein
MRNNREIPEGVRIASGFRSLPSLKNDLPWMCGANVRRLGGEPNRGADPTLTKLPETRIHIERSQWPLPGSDLRRYTYRDDGIQDEGSHGREALPRGVAVAPVPFAG